MKTSSRNGVKVREGDLTALHARLQEVNAQLLAAQTQARHRSWARQHPTALCRLPLWLQGWLMCRLHVSCTLPVDAHEWHRQLAQKAQHQLETHASCTAWWQHRET